jgi:NAD(P)-dependent dehydrogenase (short-subunit alcohol dehydrogenase family)
LITGASSGIGAVYADRLAARGYNLVLVARREDRLQALAATFRRYGVAVHILVADLSDENGIRAVEETLRNDTRIDTLVNNAGTAQMAPFLRRGGAASGHQHPEHHGADALDLRHSAASGAEQSRHADQHRLCAFPARPRR